MKNTPQSLLALGIICVLSGGCQFLNSNAEGHSMRDRMALLLAGGTPVIPDRGALIQDPKMTLTVPQGAVSEPTNIVHVRTSVPAPKGSVVPTQAAYTFGPERLQFNKPATLEICYDSQDLLAKQLEERTMQIHYVTPQGQYVSMGGEVDLARHCVRASIYHFSTYVLTAQLLELGDNPPTIGGATFFPSTPIVDLPLLVRSNITDWDAGSAVASVRLFYRVAGSGNLYTPLTMTPETNDGTNGRFYKARIPPEDVTIAGVEYYMEAFDTLNRSSVSTASTIGAVVRDPGSAIRFDTTVTQMSAGFSRDLTVQVRGTATGWLPVPAESMSFDGGKGVTSQPTWLNVRYTPQIIGTTALLASYGNLPHSQTVNVYPGLLTNLKILYNDVELPNPFLVNGPSVTQLDAAGYDAYGNFMFVLPTLTTTGGIGTFGSGANYGKLTTPYVFPGASGTIVATLGGFQAIYNVDVVTTAVICEYNNPAATFDTSGCVFNF